MNCSENQSYRFLAITEFNFNRFPTFIEIIIYRLVGQDEVSF